MCREPKLAKQGFSFESLHRVILTKDWLPMYGYLHRNEINKTLNRFNKIRAYHIKGYNNLLPIEVFKKYAHNYQQIQINTNFHFNAIIMDIDDPKLIARWDEKGLPTPTIQVLNRDNDKGHLIWLLNTPVYKEHKHAVDYYKTIVSSLKELLQADMAYQNHQTKNFLNTNLYRVFYNDVAYDLGDFERFILKNVQYFRENNHLSHLASYSRHIYLFEVLRRYGYSFAKEENLKSKLIKQAEQINQTFSNPIKTKYIVKSIHTFCQKNQNNFRSKNSKKVMKFKKISGLSPVEFKKEVKRRQSLSAKRTTAIKKRRTSIKIKLAIDILIRNKKSLTIENLAKCAKLSTSTIRRHIQIIHLFTQKSAGFIRSIRFIVQRAKRICTGELNEPILLFYQKNVFRNGFT